jgi:RecA/RadA recombinase
VMERIPTQCKAVDDLLDGGLATGTITQVFGEKALGKSIFSHQAACSVVAGGSSAIILDTEQSYSAYLLPYRQAGMNKRFGKDIPVRDLKLERVPKQSGKKKGATRGELLTAISSTLDRIGISYTDAHLGPIADILCPSFSVEVPTKEPSIMVMQTPQVTDLLNLHGVDANIEVSSGGRTELRQRQTPTYDSVLHSVIRESGAKLLIYDSISAPFKSSFPSTQDLPARSAGLAMILSHAQRLCVEFGIAVLVISHVSIDPIKAWNRRPYGGIILGHEAKFSLELTKSKARRNRESALDMEDGPSESRDERDDSSRAFWVARHPAMQEYSRAAIATMDEEGFH